MKREIESLSATAKIAAIGLLAASMVLARLAANDRGLALAAAASGAPHPSRDPTRPGEDAKSRRSRDERMIITRARVTAYGLVSPRTAQNVFSRMLQRKSIRAFKIDLKENYVWMDFVPGQVLSAEQIRRLIASAGWTPGPIKTETIPFDVAVREEEESLPFPYHGWYRFPHFDTQSRFMRWLYINFTPWTRQKPADADAQSSAH